MTTCSPLAAGEIGLWGCFKETGEFIFSADPEGCTHGAGGRERLKEMVGLVEPFSMPLFTGPNADYHPLLTGSPCAEVTVGHSHLQQKVGRLICPGG